MTGTTGTSLTWPTAQPTFSVLMPVHDPELADLERAIHSVRSQVWPWVELCLADDGSTRPEITACLDRLAKEEGVQLARHARAQGIAAATNAALALATGEFVLFLDHDDELTPDAIGVLAEAIRREPSADFVYSDHDVIDEQGHRLQTAFKPDWSPELLLSYMYIGHVKVARRTLAESLGGFREGFHGAADYDFLLRLTEHTDRIVHVPRVLYHWRAAERSMARHADTKTEAFESGRRAVAEALARRGIDAEAEWPSWAQRARLGIYRTRFRRPPQPPRISILIPTRDRLDLLRDCIASIEERTAYPRYEIVILDNESRERETLDYLASTPHRVVGCPGDFNFSRIVNRGVEACETEYVVLLNNDTLVMSRDWLDELLGPARIEGVGVVGAKLLYPDGRIQHAGVTLGIHGLTAHAFDGCRDGFSPLEYGYFAHVCRNVSAVTAACFLVARADYLAVGGLDERELGVAWNDTDFCLRMGRAGHRIVMNPHAELVHVCSASRGDAKNDREVGVMFDRWSDVIERDPYYNPNLSRLHTDFRPRTRVDEHARFHYGPGGFRPPEAAPDRRRPLRVAGDTQLDPGMALEIAWAQSEVVDRLASSAEAFERVDGLARWLAERPLLSSARFERWSRRVWDWAWAVRRTRVGAGVLRRIGLIR
jgi:GT2 family glycosyltransferase